MISLRERTPSETLDILVFWDSAKRAICAEHGLSDKELKMLMMAHYIQARTNQFLTLDQITKMTTFLFDQVTAGVKVLIRLGFIDKVEDKYNVTVKGEYVMRGISATVTRHMKGYELPKWERVKIRDVRREFLRPLPKKGATFY